MDVWPGSVQVLGRLVRPVSCPSAQGSPGLSP